MVAVGFSAASLPKFIPKKILVQCLPDESTPDPKVECGGDARHDREMWGFLIPHSQEVDKEQFVLCLGDTLIIRQHSAIDRQWADTT